MVFEFDEEKNESNIQKPMLEGLKCHVRGTHGGFEPLRWIPCPWGKTCLWRVLGRGRRFTPVA